MSRSSPIELEDSTSPQSITSALEFDSTTPPLITSQENSPLDDWLLNPTTGEVTYSGESERDMSKRSRGDVDDEISACWKSPLCPNKKEGGGRPDSCRGECADYLFAHPSELPEDKKILSEIMAKSEPKVVLETSNQQRSKRSEMESTPEPSGRTTQNKSASNTESRAPSRKNTERSSSSSTKRASASPPPKTTYDSDMSSTQQKSKGRVPHNQVEKKYRENVNAQLEALRRVVPVSKQQLVGFDGLDIEDLPMSTRQPSKAVVLSSATAYIRQLEKDNKKLLEELAALKTQNKTLQSLVKCDDCSLMNYARNWKIRGGPM